MPCIVLLSRWSASARPIFFHSCVAGDLHIPNLGAAQAPRRIPEDLFAEREHRGTVWNLTPSADATLRVAA